MNFTGASQKLKIVLNANPTTEMDVIVEYWLNDSATTNPATLNTIGTTTHGSSLHNLISGLSSTQSAILESLSIANRDSFAFIVSIYYEFSGTDRLWRMFNLNPGETMDFHKHTGWQLLDGSVTNEGVAIFPVRDTDLVPSDGNPLIYGFTLCGRDILKMNANDPIQSALWSNPPVMFFCSGSTGTWLGTTGTNAGTGAGIVSTSVNLYTMLRRQAFSSVVTTTNQQVGTRTDAIFTRGDAAGRGGFFVVAYFAPQFWRSGNRLFVGFSVGTTAVVTVQPSTLFNIFGFCVEAGDTAITLLHNDGSGTGVKETIASKPALAANQGYRGFFYCEPNSDRIYWMLEDINAGYVKLAEGTVTTELPDNSLYYNFHAIASNGANTTAGDGAISIPFIYIR